MTTLEFKSEHSYRYEERLGLLGVEGPPTTDQHNMAVIEADEAIAGIKRCERSEMAQSLTDLKNSL